MSDDTAGERWQAAPEDMEMRRQLADLVETPLSRHEQETGLSFFGDDDRFDVTTYSQPIVRALLEHDYAQLQWLYTTQGDGRGGRVDDPSEISASAPGVTIEGVRATLPLGTLTVKGVPRTKDRVSRIVNTPEDAREAAVAFRGGGE